jgi:hypothetical protein
VWAALQVTAHEAVFVHADVERHGAGVFDCRCPVFLHQGKHSQDAAEAGLSLPVIDQLAELADVGSGVFGPPQQLHRAQRHFLGVVFLLDAVPTASLAQVLAEKLVGVRMPAEWQISPHAIVRDDPGLQPQIRTLVGLQRWADTCIHGTTKRQVAAMFAEEKPHLLPLALEPFRYYQYGERVVHLDGCVEVEAAYYSLPPGWIGRPVKVQWDALHVRILRTMGPLP